MAKGFEWGVVFKKAGFMSQYKKDYDEKGFVVIDGIFNSGEISWRAHNLVSFFLSRELDRYVTDINAGYMELDKKDHTAIERLYQFLRCSSLVMEIVSNHKISSIVEELLGLRPYDSIYIPYQVVRMDPPRDNRFTYEWHQESYYSMFGADQVQLWMPMMCPATIANGTMSILMGSHLRGEVKHCLKKTPGGHEQKCIKKDLTKWPDGEYFASLNVGQVVLFHPHAIHRSNENRSKEVRFSLVAAYSNPYDSRFKITSDQERNDYHRSRCWQ